MIVVRSRWGRERVVGSRRGRERLVGSRRGRERVVGSRTVVALYWMAVLKQWSRRVVVETFVEMEAQLS